MCEPIGSGMSATIERDNTPASSDEKNEKDAAEDEEFEVEQILDTKMSGEKRLFKVRWKNYGSERDTWEPVDSLKDGAEESMKEFMIKYDADKKSKMSKSRKRPSATPTSASTKPTRSRRSTVEDADDESLPDTVSSSDGEGFTSSSKKKISFSPPLLSGCSSSSGSKDSSVSHPPSTPAKNDSSAASTSSTTTSSLSPTTKKHQKRMKHIKQNLDVQMFKAFTEQLARVPQMIEEVEKNEQRKKEKKEKKKMNKRV